MNELRAFCVEKLSRPPQDIAASNAMWDKRAQEFSRLSPRPDRSGAFDFFKARAELKGRRVLDVGCGAGRYLKRLLDEGALAEGLEPSAEMAAQARAWLARSGYAADAGEIHNVAFQDFELAEAYDYVFISNSPVISHYENYSKIVSLARRGLFVCSWLKISDLFLEEIAAALGREPHTHGGSDLVYFMNILLADGWYPDFHVSVRSGEERLTPETFCRRYASWLYGPEFGERELALVAREIDARLGDDGKAAVSSVNIMGMLYAERRL